MSDPRTDPAWSLTAVPARPDPPVPERRPRPTRPDPGMTEAAPASDRYIVFSLTWAAVMAVAMIVGIPAVIAVESGDWAVFWTVQAAFGTMALLSGIAWLISGVVARRVMREGDTT